MANRFYGSYRKISKPREHGPRGIRRRVQDQKRQEAEERNSITPDTRRRTYRRAMLEMLD